MRVEVRDARPHHAGMGAQATPVATEKAAPSAATGIRLNLGCGNKEVAGFVGVDRFPCAAARVLCDLERRLPFRDRSVDAVHLDNVVEHVRDLPGMMREIARVCRPGARVTILTPHFSALASWRDPTHVHHLSYFSMDHFAKEASRHYAGGGFRIVRRELSFVGGPMGLVARILFALSADSYEKHFCFVFRGGTLRFELEAVG
ncbi:MAG: methyltransferase domain-containing protein [Planctomycetes bacterium]|nr:methyltransferase domain-containing protein [Planctomycetota bacterium]